MKCKNGLHEKTGPGNCVECRRASYRRSSRRYQATAKGRAAKMRRDTKYKASAKGRAAEVRRATSGRKAQSWKKYAMSAHGSRAISNLRHNSRYRMLRAEWFRKHRLIKKYERLGLIPSAWGPHSPDRRLA